MLPLTDDISSYSKEVAKGSLWSLLGNAFFKLSSFFYVILIARMASPDDIGLFYLALAVLTIIELFSNFGFPMVMQRYVPYFEGKKEFGKVKYLLRVGYILLTATGILAIAVLWLLSDTIAGIYHEPGLSEAIRLFALYIILNAILRLHTFYLQGRTDIKSMQFIGNAQNFLKLVITGILFYFYGTSVTILIVGYLLSLLLAIVISLRPLHRRIADLPGTIEKISKKEIVKEIAPFGVVMTLISMFWVVTSTFDRLLIGYLAPNATEAVAIYSIAATFAGVLMLLPLSVGTIFLPLMSRLTAQKKFKEMHEITETASRWAMLLSIPVAMVMMSFSGEILAIFYGEVYRTGGAVMAILTLAFLIRTFSVMLSQVLLALRKIMIEFRISLIVSIVNILLNIVLIPIYGMEGAAVATLVSLTLLYGLLHHYLKKIFDFTFSTQIYKIMLAGVIAFIPLFFLVPVIKSIDLPDIGTGDLQFVSSKIIYLIYLVAIASLSVVFFLLAVLLLKCINRDDIILMKKALKRFYAPDPLVNLAEKILSYGLEKKK